MSRSDNRSRFPVAAGLVDSFRTSGARVSVAYAAEGGNVVGKPERAPAVEWASAVPWLALERVEDTRELAHVKNRMYGNPTKGVNRDPD